MYKGMTGPVRLLHTAVVGVAAAWIAGSAVAADAPAASNARRPQLTAAQAAAYSVTEVLKYAGAIGSETLDPWDPLADALTDARAALPKPDYTVDAQAKANGIDMFNSVQAAVAKAVTDNTAAAQPRKRVYILVKPGVYHELLYVPTANVAITLVGGDADAGKTTISANLDASVSGGDYARVFGGQFAATDPVIAAMYAVLKEKPILDTVGTATVWIKDNGFQARNITFENAYSPGQDASTVMIGGQRRVIHHQAVALMVDGADKAQFENVRLLGHQDTLFVKIGSAGKVTRIFFDRSYVEGDVDFIFGDATTYFYRSEIKSLGDRPSSYATAPNTSYASKYGFVFNASRFTNDGSAAALAGKYYLGRQWFHSQKCTPYGTMQVPGYACSLSDHDSYSAPTGTISKGVLETVGKVAILNSTIGAHINKAQPWSEWNANGSLSHRPAQYDSDDYWNNLLAIKIDPIGQLGYRARKDPVEPFLTEFNNTDE